MEKKPVIQSYGGGTQSIAIVLLMAMGKLPRVDRVVFADTGREASETFEYTEQYVAPLLAKELGLGIETASHTLATVDLYSKKSRDLLIPAYTQTGKLDTFCSQEWKTRVVRRYLKSQGVEECVMWIGMSTDEVERLKPSDVQWLEHAWPLCGMPVSHHFGIQMSRNECKQLVMNFGWPEPPKSSCYICPHRRNAQWQRLKTFYPEDFEKAVQLDKETRAHDKQGGVWLHESKKPLDEIDFTKEDRPALFGCDSGFCW